MSQNSARKNHLGPTSSIVHSLTPPSAPGAPLGVQPVFASAFQLDGDQEKEPFFYARNANPMVLELEQALSVLDNGAESVVSASGMAAISQVFRALLSQGDVVVIPSDGYYHSRDYAIKVLTTWGIEVIAFDSGSFVEQLRELEKTPALVLVETPSNPELTVVDVAAVAQWCQQRGSLLAVDNTTASPLGQRPFELGADIIIVSGTKHLAGHSDLLFGYCGFVDPDVAARVRKERTMSGPVISPFDAWLVARSLVTYPLRFERQCATAQALAQALTGHPEVRKVHYPGLSSSPYYELATRQMQAYGTVVSIELASEVARKALLTGGTLVRNATSFGGTHTTCDRRARWGDSVPDNFLRISVGIEDTADVVAEFTRLLDL